MKNLLSLISLFLLLQVNGIAQDSGYFAISRGISYPQGNFASNDPNNNLAGYAESGGFLNLSFTYKFNKYLGATILYNLQAYETDGEPMTINFTQTIGVPMGIEYVYGSSTWSMGSYLAGIHGSFTILKKLCFESNLLIGYSNVWCPSISHLVYVGPWEVRQGKKNSTISFLIGAGLKYNIIGHVCLLANAEYMVARPEFKNVEIIKSDGPDLYISFSKPIQVLNYSLGLGYRL
ncbi:MAG: hypothetical protein Q8M15_13030 [Bacteroidota bacterium]|nr:hypothetical protein [Bacteroidota bacterium]